MQPLGFIKVNTDGDGSVKENGMAGAAAVIRNSNKVWSAGVTRKVFGISPILEEALAIFDGPSLCFC